MKEPQSPLALCEKLQQERRHRTDDAILAELRQMTPLPHEDDSGWYGDWRTEPLWHRGYLFDVLKVEVCQLALSRTAS